MLTLTSSHPSQALAWQRWDEKLQTSTTLASLVITAWQIGRSVAQVLVEQQLHQRAQQEKTWGFCAQCAHPLQSKGWVGRRMLTLVGWVEWQRRVGRCPHHCPGSQQAPFDQELGIEPYQQTSMELMRLGCLLAVLLPFELATELLAQLSGAHLSDATLWQWVQTFGKRATQHLEAELQSWVEGHPPQAEPLDEALAALPLVIAADGVTVPLRPTPGSAKGSIVWREVKVGLLTRLGTKTNRVGKTRTELRQHRLVAGLGPIDALQVRLQLEAARQNLESTSQVVWISDGARGFWRLYEQSFAPVAVGILDFYHASGHLWRVAQAYGNTVPHRTPQAWFERLRHQLRHGYVHRIIKELNCLLRYRSTPDSAKATLQQVHDYLTTHQEHLRYREFKKQGWPIGSGMVESACKWLIAQRFKGVGMRWSEQGLNHLLHLRLAWVNQRFDSLFSLKSLTLSSDSPNH
jgi:hypothetical protein